ncbi:MAG TPA: DUF2092 domain-containing protein [Candidatus Limnocylindrales bacterium]|nr:DUF2092 domain-containing protein [Candidatus Limnocylindrales bacterium]
MISNWKSICVAVALAATSRVAAAGAVVTPEAARARLLEMADTLGKAKAFSVRMHSDYDAVQRSGQKVEFGDTREVLVRRPDALRIDVERSDGEQSVVLYDGKSITVSTPSQGVYAQVEKAGSLDDAVRYFRQDLKMQLPLAAMLLTTFRQELDSRLSDVEYVESTHRFGKEADHFAARGTDVDAQFWVSVDDPPMLQRVVITYKNADEQPQYATTFEDWDFSPSASSSKFRFEADKNAHRIAFLPQVAPQIAASVPKAATAAKEKKP